MKRNGGINFCFTKHAFVLVKKSGDTESGKPNKKPNICLSAAQRSTMELPNNGKSRSESCGGESLTD